MIKLLSLNLIFVFSLSAFAESIAVRSPESRYSDFKIFLENKAGVVSQLDFYSNSPAPTFDFDGSWESLKKMEMSLQQQPLNSEGVSVLVALLIKKSELRSLTADEQGRLQFLFEQNASLRQAYFDQWMKLSSFKTECSPLTAALTQYLRQLRYRSDLEEAVLLADGVPVTTENVDKIKDINRHWTLLSNTYQPLVVVGSFNDFIAAQSQLKAEAKGLCSDPFLAPGRIGFYSANCVIESRDEASRSGELTRLKTKEPEKTKIWPWVVGGVLGSLALSASQGKKIVITGPSFK